MKILSIVLLLASVIVILSGCKDKTLIYTADEYDIIVSERDALTAELSERLAKEEIDKNEYETKYNNIISERDTLIKELNESRDENRIMEDEFLGIIADREEIIRGLNEAQANKDIAETEDSSASAGKVETERKFLLDVNNLPGDLMRLGIQYEFVQTYISYSPEIRIRARTGYRNDFQMTIKVPLDDIGLSRQEIEFFISEDEYNELLTKKVGNTINKTRYEFWVGNHFVAIDVYSGNLAGLAVSEVAFKSVEAAIAFVPPEWFGEDITSDKRFKNASLAKDGLPTF